jgi:hypothetical protein
MGLEHSACVLLVFIVDSRVSFESAGHRTACPDYLLYFPSRVLAPQFLAIVHQIPSLAFAPHSSPCLLRVSTPSPLQRARRSFPSFMMLSGDHTLTSSSPTPTRVFPCMLHWRTYKRASTSQVLPSTILQFRGGPAGISLRRARAVSGASRSCVPMPLWLRSD